MDRLESIVERNRKPKWWKGQISFGLRSIFLLVILGMLIFTKWAFPPDDHRDLAPKIVPAGGPRVDGVQLRRPAPAPQPPATDQGVRP